MKGLLLKDIFNLKKYGKQIAIIVVLYAVLGYTSGTFNFLGACIIVIGSMMVLTSMTYDDLAKWDKYALTMPLSRRDLVKSKYILLLLASFGGFIIALLLGVIMLFLGTDVKINEIGLLCGIVLEFSLFAFSIIMPLVFQYGVERARIILIAILVSPTIIGVFIMKFLMPNIAMDVKVLNQIMRTIGILSPFIILLILYLSYQISVKIFEKKAF